MFERHLQREYAVRALVDHGGFPDCFFHCINALLHATHLPSQTVPDLRDCLATELELMHPSGIGAQWFGVAVSVLETQPNMPLNPEVHDWPLYLQLLRGGQLFGGDIEIGAVQNWMQRVHGHVLNIRVWTPEGRDPFEDLGDDRQSTLTWNLARFGAHFRVVSL
jgi:hypothetical protein